MANYKSRMKLDLEAQHYLPTLDMALFLLIKVYLLKKKLIRFLLALALNDMSLY